MDTPPPYPSGKPWHPGALTQYSQIDMIARAARMRGLQVLYPVGIDRNGLPVEIFAERKYRVQMRKTPREEFINLCKHALDDLEVIHGRAHEDTGDFGRLPEQVQDGL